MTLSPIPRLSPPRLPLLAALAAAIAAMTVPGVAAAMSAPAAAQAPSPSAELPVIERRVMCVTCKIPLDVAQSLQANRERAYIRGLLAEGKDPAQVERALVGQYGPTVLALPADSGFDLTAYLVPVVAVLILLILLAALLPRWRRRARARAVAIAGAGAPGSSPSPTPAQNARLDADLARFER
ncbi:MAG TPA: cytochrome c-type biogenesis protein CcmH [Solirubrobacteraceae bacterium]|nr:cytochrome c-type biogenesis protein CcmH [Solirubrobacteraceae bacterium]